MGAPTEIDLIHANLPAHVDMASARLPQSYEAAKRALAACERLDECKTWADKMAALASYARQVEDDTLLKTAIRIHGRALRRVGELLEEFDARRRQNRRAKMGATLLLRQRRPAAPSRRPQASQGTSRSPPFASRMCRPTSSRPPSKATTHRRSRGWPRPEGRREKRSASTICRVETPSSFYAATHTLGAMEMLAEKCTEYAPEVVAGGLGANEVQRARNLVARIDAWLNSFFANIKG